MLRSLSNNSQWIIELNTVGKGKTSVLYKEGSEKTDRNGFFEPKLLTTDCHNEERHHNKQQSFMTMWRTWVIAGLLVYTLSSHTVTSFIRTFPTRTSISSTTKRSAEEKKPTKPKKSKFDRVVDDFIGKRFGAGDYFYGERISQLTDEEYVNQYEAVDEEEKVERPLRENAILLVGSLEAMGQWVAFELAEKGFNIRVAVASKAQAVKIFGQNNVDIVELSDQQATATGENPYAKALSGVQAIVFLPAFKPFLDVGPLAATSRAEMAVASRVLDAARAAKASQQKRSSEIQKVVFVSRVVPWLLDNKSSSSSSSSSSGGKVNFLSALLNERVDSDLYNGFRLVHADFEQKVRESGFDYVVVRAPPVVEEAKEGARSELVILDQSGSAVSSSSSSLGSSSSSAFSGSVGMLDLVSKRNTTHTISFTNILTD